MTIKELKNKTLQIIEEFDKDLEPLFTNDEDILSKINGSTNQILMDLMKYRKTIATVEYVIEEETEKIIDLRTISDFYQLDKIKGLEDVEYEINSTLLELPTDFIGTIKLYYYRLPKLLPLSYPVTVEEIEYSEDVYENTFNADLDPVLLEIAPYGIAADLLKLDMISNYGSYFYARYKDMLGTIDSRNTGGMITFEGGYEF